MFQTDSFRVMIALDSEAAEFNHRTEFFAKPLKDFTANRKPPEKRHFSRINFRSV